MYHQPVGKSSRWKLNQKAENKKNRTIFSDIQFILTSFFCHLNCLQIVFPIWPFDPTQRLNSTPPGMQRFLILFQPELRSGAVRQFLRQVSLSLFLRVCCGSSAADRTAIQKNHWSVQRVPIGSATDRSIDRWSGKLWTTPSRSVTTHIDSRPCSEKNREKIIPLLFFLDQ